jgi:hypothetical protein
VAAAAAAGVEHQVVKLPALQGGGRVRGRLARIVCRADHLGIEQEVHDQRGLPDRQAADLFGELVGPGGTGEGADKARGPAVVQLHTRVC